MIPLLVLVTALGAALGVFYPFISVILAERGFSPGEIGLVFSLGAIGFTIAVPAWGHLADVRFGRPRTLQVCAIVAAIAVLGLLAPVAPLIVVALLLVFWVFESAWQPLADAITVNMTGGRDYARIRLFTSAGFAIATIASGFLYDAVAYAPAYVLMALAAAAMTLAALGIPDVARADLAAHRRRTDGVAAQPPAGRRLGLGSTGVAFRVAPRLGAVLVATTLLHVGIISGFTFLPLRIGDLGGAPSDIALSAGLSATMEIPAMLAIGVLARRIGLRIIFTVATLGYAACMASWMVLDEPLLIVLTRAVTGVGFAGVIISVVLTIAAILPKELQGTGQSLFQTSAFGLAAIAANVIGGVLYEGFGHAALFGVGAVLAVAAAIIGWVAFPRSHA